MMLPPWIYAVLCLGAVLLGSAAFAVVKNREPRQAGETGNVSTLLVWGAGIIGITIAILDWILIRSQMLRWGSITGGCALIGIGLSLRVASRLALGKFYTPRLVILSDHKLITSGIYGIIRHPGYLGFLFIAIGICLALGAWWGVAAMLAAFFPAILFRIRREDALLRSRFGAAYDAYAARTKKLIPWIY